MHCCNGLVHPWSHVVWPSTRVNDACAGAATASEEVPGLKAPSCCWPPSRAKSRTVCSAGCRVPDCPTSTNAGPSAGQPLAERPGGGPSKVAKVINHPLVYGLHCLSADKPGQVEELGQCSLRKEGLPLLLCEQAEQGAYPVQRCQLNVLLKTCA